MSINTAGINVDLTQSLPNAVSARMLSNVMKESAVQVDTILQMLPKAGTNEVGGLLDARV
jgi:hypothetical protein